MQYIAHVKCCIFSICYPQTRIESTYMPYWIITIGGGDNLISYEPFFKTMKEKGISKYQLIYYWGISSNTLRRMSHNEPISTPTLNELCLILNCQVQDIICFEPTSEENEFISEKRNEIEIRKSHRKKPL